MEILSFEAIKALYPNEWVLIGDPVLDDETTLGSIADKLLRGVVLLHGKDKRVLAAQTNSARTGFDSVACVFTGEFPKNRKYWRLSTMLAAKTHCEKLAGQNQPQKTVESAESL